MKKKWLNYFISFAFEALISAALVFGGSTCVRADEYNTGLVQPEALELTEEMIEENDSYFEKMNGESFDDAIDSVGSMQYESEWDKYSSNYYYNKLNAYEKDLWDQMDEACLAVLTGSDDFKVYNSRQESYGFFEAGTYTGISEERATEVGLMFRLSNPQYYFLYANASFDEYGNEEYLYIYSGFADGDDRASATKAFKAGIDEALKAMASCSTDYEKEKCAHDWICNRVVYDNDYDKPYGSIYHQVAYSVFSATAWKNGYTTVCAGYSQAFELLMNAVDIDCTVLTSTDHEWNIVKIYGNWYYVDCTWDDDDSSSAVLYSFFNRNYTSFVEYESHIPEDIWKSYLPYETTVVGPDSGSSYYTAVELLDATDELVSIEVLPTISLANGKISISFIDGYTIYYTTDGNDPSEAYSRSMIYTGPFSAPSTGVVKAVAVRYGYTDSQVAEKRFSTYKVTFINEGSTYKTVSVVETGTVSKPTTPTKIGYTLAGWYTDSACKNSFDFSTQVTENLKLYAKWTVNKYTLTFKSNGSGSYLNNKKTTNSLKMSYTYGSAIGKMPSAKRSGYAFLGWYTAKSDGKLVLATGKYSYTKNMTLYAHWGKLKTSKAVISKLSSKSGKLTVKIKKISNANGYQIMYSAKSSFKGAKKIKTADTSTSGTISSLKTGSTYYVKVRMYQKDSVSGKVSYGPWSTIKSIKIK